MLRLENFGLRIILVCYTDRPIAEASLGFSLEGGGQELGIRWSLRFWQYEMLEYKSMVFFDGTLDHLQTKELILLQCW